MRYAFITGGLGLIGSHIARRLLAEDHVDKAVLLDHYGSYITPTLEEYADYRSLRVKGIEDRVIVERCQTSYPNVVSHLLFKYQPKQIYHLAALPLASLDNINTQEAIEGSVLSTSYILEICNTLKQEIGYQLERFIYTSSSMVYGDFQYSPADEEHPKQPATIYGVMKLAGEEVARGLGRTFGIDTTIIRPSAVYGPTDMNRRVTQIFLERAMLGKKLVVQGADEKLDFTFVEDVAKGFVLAGTKPEGANETFNVTSGHAYTLVEFAEVLRQHFPKMTYEVRERDASRPKRGTLAIDKAKRLLGYAPDFTLEEGVRRYVDFVEQHGDEVSRQVRRYHAGELTGEVPHL